MMPAHDSVVATATAGGARATLTSAAASSSRADVRLAIAGVTVRYGPLVAVDDVSIDVTEGELVCLLGPSGSGKSTLLRLVAGLERPDAGRIVLDGAEVSGPRTFVEADRRRVGMVFQDFALFPHLTIAGNLAFGLRGRPRGEAAAMVAAMLDRVELAGYAGSYPHTLSGGERQRAAVARALVTAPRILLMDEPFSSLDDRLRDRVRRQTVDLLRGTRTTTIVVTHDPDEAMRIADRIVLLHRGRLIQCGRPDEIYARPASLFAARFFSDINELPGICRGGRVDTPIGVFDAPRLADGQAVSVCVRPQHVRVSATPAPLSGHVIRTSFLGELEQLSVAVAGLAAPLTVRAFAPTAFNPGDRVSLDINPTDVLVFANDRDPSIPTVSGVAACEHT